MIHSLRTSFHFMRGNILVLSLATLLGQFSRSMVFPYASLYILALGGSPEQIGLINSLAPLLGLLMFPIGGYLTDHGGRVKLIAYSSYASGAVILLYVIAPSWHLIALAMLLQGIMTVQFPARSALVADSLSPADRGRGVGAMSTLSSTFSIVAPYVAGLVVDAYGPNLGIRALYGAMMLLYLASGAVQHRFLTETSPNAHNRVQWSRLPAVFRQAYSGAPGLLLSLPRSLKALTAVLVLGFMANAIVSGFWVVYAVEEIGLAASSWGLILLLETLVRSVGFIPAGLVVDRWGRSRSLALALTLALFSFALFVFVRGFAAVLALRVLVGVSTSLIIPASTALIADTVPRHKRGQVMAAIGQGGIMLGAAGGGTGGPGMGFVLTVPVMTASVLGGILYGLNPTYPWVVITATTLISIFLTLFWIRDPQEGEV